MKRLITEAAMVAAIILPAWAVVEFVNTPAPAKPVEVFSISESQTETKPLAQFLFYTSSERVNITAKEKDCLTKNIYHEAGVESLAGRIAVAQVTWNRVKNGQWGKDVCKVVYAKAQFSWTLDARKRNAAPKGPLWEASKEAAEEFITGTRISRLDRSLHYHADYVNPKWADEDRKIKQIGTHIFYALK